MTYEERVNEVASELAVAARDFAGRYLVRLDSLKPEDAEAAFERLKDAARDFVSAEAVPASRR